MVLFKKYSVEIAVLSMLALVFFLSRFYDILSLPIFTDEAIYVRWAQIAKADPNWRFISLTDGKQPLYIWGVMVAMKFIQDPLLAGRTVSVFAGFASLIGLFLLGKEVFKNKYVGLISAGLYLIYPFAMVYDRMALYDSLVATCAIWSLYLQVLLMRKFQLSFALIAGMIMGAGVLNKTSGFISMYLLPFSLLLFPWSQKERLVSLGKWILFIGVIVGQTYAYYSILRLSPFAHIIEEKNTIFIYPFKEWMQHPLEFFWGNLFVGEWDWLRKYMTIPWLVLAVLSFFVNKNFFREKLLLFLWFIVPFIGLALFGKTLYPRFIFFMTLPLLPLIAYTIWQLIEKVKHNTLFVVLIIFIVNILAIRVSSYVLFNFARAPIPLSDVNQYNNDWPSGAGMQEAIAFFQREAEEGKIVVATQGTFGLLPAALEIYLKDNPNIQITGIWPIDSLPSDSLIELSKKNTTFIIFYQPCNPCVEKGQAPPLWNMEKVFEYKKVVRNAYLTIYRVRPQ